MFGLTEGKDLWTFGPGIQLTACGFSFYINLTHWGTYMVPEGFEVGALASFFGVHMKRATENTRSHEVKI